MNCSLIIVTYQRSKLLGALLNSLVYQVNLFNQYEILIGLNGDDSVTLSYLKTAPLPIHFYIFSKSSPGNIRNKLLSKAKFETILFLDDDVVCPVNYIERGIHQLIKFPDIDVLGGPDQLPPQSTTFQKNLSLCLENYLVMGPTYARHRSLKNQYNCTEKHLILCHLWIRRSSLPARNNIFDPTLFRNEENSLLLEMRKNGKICYYDPLLKVDHYRKSNIKGLSAACFKSGQYRLKNIYQFGIKEQLVYFVPLFSVILIFISTYLNFASFLYFSCLYLIFIFYITFQLSVKSKKILYLPMIIIPSIHLSYVSGQTFSLGALIITSLLKVSKKYKHAQA